jgi:hypothetical protein
MQIEADISVVPYEPIENETWWSYGNGTVKVHLWFNKVPSQPWTKLFEATVQERMTATERLLQHVSLEKSGTRVVVSCIVTEALNERVLEGIREVVGVANDKARAINEKAVKDADAQSVRIHEQRETAKRIVEKLKGK